MEERANKKLMNANKASWKNTKKYIGRRHRHRHQTRKFKNVNKKKIIY